jgi:hypothetical protein
VPGQRAQIIVQAVNGSSQGVASEPIVFTMPLPAAAEAAEPSSADEGEGVTSAKDGSNCHASSRRMPALS